MSLSQGNQGLQRPWLGFIMEILQSGFSGQPLLGCPRPAAGLAGRCWSWLPGGEADIHKAKRIHGWDRVEVPKGNKYDTSIAVRKRKVPSYRAEPLLLEFRYT
jgi:hypothetical protein